MVEDRPGVSTCDQMCNWNRQRVVTRLPSLQRRLARSWKKSSNTGCQGFCSNADSDVACGGGRRALVAVGGVRWSSDQIPIAKASNSSVGCEQDIALVNMRAGICWQPQPPGPPCGNCLVGPRAFLLDPGHHRLGFRTPLSRQSITLTGCCCCCCC